MNQLQFETSPYLLQHAHNPVNWYAWKPEAFERALKEDKPVLVSIGYSTCHWCHVMERESFEDKEVAGFMNDHFICIKVDREERPDVDQIYMEACQVLTGSGGWPLNVFLLPDKRPFYAGTYYPPMPAYNRPSWLQVLMNLSHSYQHKRETVEDQANRLTEIIQNAGNTFIKNNLRVVNEENPFTQDAVHAICQGLQRSFDRRNGGFGGAPKFPGTMSLHFLLAYHFFTFDQSALDQVTLSLDKMAMGGIYDHLGGGFARYATDAKWLIPHFEKMLYDNALLVSLYAEAYSFTGNARYKEVVEETLDWVAREMTHPDGGFYAAQDADSEGEEGKFYVWQQQEIESLLGPDAALFCDYYGVSEGGNWEGKNILWCEKDLESFTKEKGLDPDDWRLKLKDCQQILFNARRTRVYPGLDDKVLLDWNALMCAAYAKAYRALGHEAYKQAALKNLDFIRQNFRQKDGQNLFHAWKDGKAQYDAFLDDYANLIDALVNVYEITFDEDLLKEAESYTDFVIRNFQDERDHIFYFTSVLQQDILLRRKDLYDSATPSGNSMMVYNLQRMGILTGKTSYRTIAGEMLLTMKESIEKYPGSFSQWASMLLNEVFGIPEIAVIGEEALALASRIRKTFIPHAVWMASMKENDAFPLLEGKTAGEDTVIYVCRNYTCQQPVRTLEAFRQLIRPRMS